MDENQFTSDPLEVHKLLVSRVISEERLQGIIAAVQKIVVLIESCGYTKYWRPLQSPDFEPLGRVVVGGKMIALEVVLSEIPTLAALLPWDEAQYSFAVFHYTFNTHELLEEDLMEDLDTLEELNEFTITYLKENPDWKQIGTELFTCVALVEELVKHREPCYNLSFFLLCESYDKEKRNYEDVREPYVEPGGLFTSLPIWNLLISNVLKQYPQSKLLAVDCLEFEGNHNDDEICVLLRKGAIEQEF